MNIEELKTKIENNENLPNILIFKLGKSESSDFLFHQYLNKYCKDKGLDIVRIENLDEVSSSNLFNISSDELFLYEITKLEMKLPFTNDNIWIKCTSIPKKLVDEYSNIIVELPKIEEWQIKDYIYSNVHGLVDKSVDKLYSNYKSNLFRLELELEKLSIFETGGQNIYEEVESQLFVDSTEYTIFDITNCILRKDINSLLKLKDNISLIDIDPFGLIKILINNFRYIIDIQLAKNSTSEYVGISNKQFWAIKNYSCGYYTKEELVYIYKFLLALDDQIKSGYISADIVIDYIVCKIMLI